MGRGVLYRFIYFEKHSVCFWVHALLLCYASCSALPDGTTRFGSCLNVHLPLLGDRAFRYLCLRASAPWMVYVSRSKDRMSVARQTQISKSPITKKTRHAWQSPKTYRVFFKINKSIEDAAPTLTGSCRFVGGFGRRNKE